MSKLNCFILGCERSGSTWLLNMLDHSPQVLTYLEPFADYINHIKSFPPRYLYAEKSFKPDPLFESLFDDLYKEKYSFLYKPGGSLFSYSLDRILSSKVNLKGIGRADFRELLKADAPLRRKRRRSQIQVSVIKELRLNFKLELIAEVFPKSKIVVAIRDPLLQIQSISNWIGKGRLVEFARNLDYFIHYLSRQESLKPFCKGFDMMETLSFYDKLSIYWIVNYEVLIRDVKNSKLDYIVLKNEDIILNGRTKLEEMLDFLSIDDCVEVKKYFMRSSNSSDLDVSNPLNTNRNALDSLNSSKGRIDPQLRNVFDKWSYLRNQTNEIYQGYS